MTRRLRAIPILLLTALLLGGCQARPANVVARRAYYAYDFPAAREALRADAYLANDEDTILNNLRLGLAAMADGDPVEAEAPLLRVFDLLSTAGLNEDRTTAAVLTHEGVRIWKGEPFEQALAYAWIATLYATLGDWENVRAAAANATFRLRDFGESGLNEALDDEALARRAARDPDFLATGYRAVESDFALGFLLQGLGAALGDVGDPEPLFDAAVEAAPRLEPVVDVLRAGTFNTLLVVDYGRGPEKIAHGPDFALADFVPVDDATRPLLVHAPGGVLARVPPAADVNRLARDHRWNNLEDVRRAKSAIGDALLAGGFVTTAVGARHESGEAALAGIGMILGGMLTKSGAQADVRYLDFAPASVYLAPLMLPGPTDVAVQAEGDAASRYVMPGLVPGEVGRPRVVYLRLFGEGSPTPRWLIEDRLAYTNDFTGPVPGGEPWILGGRDVSLPTPEVVATYRSEDVGSLTVEALEAMYETEGIVLGSGPPPSVPPGERNPFFRHVLDGGRALFTPLPFSVGYKRLMYRLVGPYRPRSEWLRELRFDAPPEVEPIVGSRPNR